MRKIKFEEAYIDKNILKKMNKREKALENKIKLLEKENEKLQLKLNKAKWDLLTADP